MSTHSHPHTIYPHLPPTTHKKCPTTPTNPKYISIHPTHPHLPIKSIHPPSPTHNIFQPPPTFPHPPPENVQSPPPTQIIPPPTPHTPPTHKKYPPTPTHPKYSSTYSHPTFFCYSFGRTDGSEISHYLQNLSTQIFVMGKMEVVTHIWLYLR